MRQKKEKKNRGRREQKQQQPKRDLALIVIDLFNNNPTRVFSQKDIVSYIGGLGKEGKEKVRETLQKLLSDQVVVLTERGKYRLTVNNQNLLTGRVDAVSGGAYIVIPDAEKDIFVDQANLNHALHDDIVKIALIRRRRASRIEGEVIEIVERSNKKYVGKIQLEKSFAFVTLDNRHIHNDIFIPLRDVKNAENGQKVVVRIIDWPLNMKNPIGEVLDVLGNAGENNTEMHAILAEYDLPYSFPEDVNEAAKQIPEEIPQTEYAKRRDFRGITTFTIDPFDAKDFDDALSIRQLENGNWEVGVHIADVTYYVTEGSLIEKEAENRATSIYLVDRVVPMLPEHLSNFLCSLRPNEEKLCFSAVFEMNENAEIITQWFGRTVIKSDRRFTYEEAQAIIEGGDDQFKDQILTLNRLARVLRKERFKNGSIAFEREEPKFELDENGKPLSVYFKVMKESNQLIEEFMLLANKRVAEFGGKKDGKKSERTFVYRIHDVPSPEKYEDLSKFIVKFGYNLKATTARTIAREINGLMNQIKGKKEENIVSTLAIRTMAKAVYSTTNIGHYGLAFDYYTHFTSPIRRYPDMMVHRLLARYLESGSSADKDFFENQCDHSSAMELRASEAERASIKYKMVEFMTDKIGVDFEGFISGVTEWGVYVELKETKIEGMVSLRDMTDDYYIYDDKNYCVTGRVHRKVFSLGDRVMVKVKRADLARKQLDFEMVAKYEFGSDKPEYVNEELN